MALSALLYSCRIEEELNPKNGEAGNLQYGISKEVFMGSLFVTGLKSSSSKNVASALTAEELVERLDLAKAHLNAGNGKEVFHVPVRTFGSYKRSLLSISENGNSRAVLLTYPNPEDHKLFYITDLNGNLLKEVKIGDNGKEIATAFSGKISVQGKTDDCSIVVYTTCSSGEHSFEWGNAYSCTFWHNTGAGTPPTLFTQAGGCPSGGGGTPIGGDGSSGGHPAGGSGTSPVGGGGPPKNQLTPANCVQNLDCENCNIPGDTNNDCMLSYDEAITFNNDPCRKIKNLVNKPQIQDSLISLKAHAQTITKTERGFQELKSGTLVQGNVNGDNLLEFGIGQNSLGTVHSHQPGTIGILAPQDIMTFLHIVRQQGSSTLGNAYSGTVSSSGTYFINFTGTASDLPPAMTDAQEAVYVVKLVEYYQKNYYQLLKAEGKKSYQTLSNSGLEKLFFNTLNKIGLSGKVALIKEDNGNISTIEKDSNGNPVPNPC
jgi:hypothetical protein